MVTLLVILASLGAMIYYSMRYNDTLKSSFECEFCGYSYSSAIITNITYNNLSHEFNIHFQYGLNNNEWNISNDNSWLSTKNNYSNYVGQIQTILLSKDGEIDLVDYNEWSGTSLSYLLSDSRWGLIAWIIFWLFSCIFSTCFCVYWMSNDKDTDGWCETIWTILLVIFIIGVLVCMVTGWPVMIMGSVMQSQIDHGSGNSIYNQYNCFINRMKGIKRFPDTNQSIVEYEVFVDEQNLKGLVGVYSVDISGNDGNGSYLEINSTQPCYQNVDSEQIVLIEMPSTEWLTSLLDDYWIWGIIILGIAGICAPCTIAILYVLGYIFGD